MTSRDEHAAKGGAAASYDPYIALTMKAAGDSGSVNGTPQVGRGGGGGGGGSGAPEAASLGGSIFNLTNCVLGGGVLTLPFCFRVCGLAFGLALLVGIALLAEYAYYLLHRSACITGDSYYNLLCYRAYGPRFCVLLDVIQTIYSFGVLVAYLIVIGGTMEPVLKNYIGEDATLTDKAYIIVFVTALVILPLCFLPKMDPLRYTSTFAVVCVFFVVSVVMARGIEFVEDETPDPELVVFDIDFFVALPIILFAYNCSAQFLPIHSELAKPTTDRTNGLLVRATLAICFGVYSLTASFGYVNFGDETEDNILLNYDDDDLLIAIARVSLSTVITFSYPLIYQPLRGSVETLIYAYKVGVQAAVDTQLDNESEAAQTLLGDEPGHVQHKAYPIPEPSATKRAIENIVIVFLSMAIAILVPSLEVVFALTGAIGASTMCYLFPGLIYLKLGGSDLSTLQKAGGWTITIFGVFAFLLSTTIVIVQAARGETT